MSTPESKPPVTEAATAEDQSSTESATESVTEQQIDSEKETSNPESHENGQDDGPEPPFSVFTIPQKRLIVILASLASLFSPLTGSIYWPATTQIAADLNTSVALINLTITTYIVSSSLYFHTVSILTKRRYSKASLQPSLVLFPTSKVVDLSISSALSFFWPPILLLPFKITTLPF